MGGQLERNLKMQLVRDFLFSPPPARGGGIMVLLESPLPLVEDPAALMAGTGEGFGVSSAERLGWGW